MTGRLDHGVCNGSAAIDLHRHPDPDRWARAAATDIAAAIASELQAGSRALALFSGGGTPAPVYHQLAGHALAWNRVDIGLVDERWVQVGDPASNATLLRDTLLRDLAAGATLVPLLQSGRSLPEAVAAANAHAGAAPPPCIAVLGMGDDGHTASLFPGAAGLSGAFADARPYAALDASGCPVAGDRPLRITLTPAGLARARARLLLIRGERKLEALRRALAPGDPAEYPVRVAITAPGAALRVHWCA